MARAIHLYVSSSPQLQPEREVAGQVVAELPLDIGWEIGHTPYSGDVAAESLRRADSCDLYVLILGHDFAAPMGAEYRQARGTGCTTMAYQKRCSQSPSAVEAVRRLDLTWRRFVELSELRQLVRRDLLQALLAGADRFGLQMDELGRLARLAEDEAVLQRDPRSGQSRRGDAGRSGIILGREVWEEEQ